MPRIALNLLAQAVDMRFERMRRDPGVVPPHLAEQRIAADDPVAGAIEIFEDRGFLFGQTHLFAGAAVDHQLGAGLKRVRPDPQHRIVAMLALPQMRAQPRQEDAEPERLRHIVIGAGIEPRHSVGLAVGRSQHDDGRADPGATHPAAQLAAIHIGEPDIEEDRVEPLAPRRGERLHRSVGLDGGKLAVLLQLLGQRMAQCRVVVDDQDLAKTAHTLSTLLPTHSADCGTNYRFIRPIGGIYPRLRTGAAAKLPVFRRPHLPDGREEWQACAETAGTPLASAYDITPYEVSLGRTADPPIARLGPSRPSHRRRPFRVAARRAGVALRPGRSRAGPRGGIRQ